MNRKILLKIFFNHYRHNWRLTPNAPTFLVTEMWTAVAISNSRNCENSVRSKCVALCTTHKRLLYIPATDQTNSRTFRVPYKVITSDTGRPVRMI
jgi:hypothetical protein